MKEVNIKCSHLTHENFTLIQSKCIRFPTYYVLSASLYRTVCQYIDNNVLSLRRTNISICTSILVPVTSKSAHYSFSKMPWHDYLVDSPLLPSSNISATSTYFTACHCKRLINLPRLSDKFHKYEILYDVKDQLL